MVRGRLSCKFQKLDRNCLPLLSFDKLQRPYEIYAGFTCGGNLFQVVRILIFILFIGFSRYLSIFHDNLRLINI